MKYFKLKNLDERLLESSFILCWKEAEDFFFNERLERVCRPCAEKFGSLVLSCVESWNECSTQSGKEIPKWPEIAAKPDKSH